MHDDDRRPLEEWEDEPAPEPTPKIGESLGLSENLRVEPRTPATPAPEPGAPSTFHLPLERSNIEDRAKPFHLQGWLEDHDPRRVEGPDAAAKAQTHAETLRLGEVVANPPPKPEGPLVFDAQQEEAIALCGTELYTNISGTAGVGKTEVAKEIIKRHPGVMLAATTGIASVNLGEGTTINALLSSGTAISGRDWLK